MPVTGVPGVASSGWTGKAGWTTGSGCVSGLRIKLLGRNWRTGVRAC